MSSRVPANFPGLPKTEAYRPPPVLNGAGPLLAAYDVVLSDVWGVVHDGVTAYPGASEALSRFRAGGGTVVLVSNAPVPNEEVARMLDGKRVPREAWDAIVSSGDIALSHIAELGYERLYWIGPEDRDAAFFTRLAATEVGLAHAEAIVCTGLDDDRNETVETYAPLLERARARDLPFVCANPDLVVDVGGTLLLCAGAIAEAYAAMGGAVYWAGKPYPIAYETALAVAQRLRAESVPRQRVLAIGDAVRTDLKAAETAGIDALFVASGIHRAETMRGEEIDAAGLARLLAAGSPPARAAMAYLSW
ncbi:MAG: TIGR01459 family HAD-type hydrolase [Pseudomonadota bacterium]